MLKGLKGKKDSKGDGKKDKKDVLSYLYRNRPRSRRRLLRKKRKTMQIHLLTWVSLIPPSRSPKQPKRLTKFRAVSCSRNKLTLRTLWSRRRRRKSRLNHGWSTKVTFPRLFLKSLIWTKSILSFRVLQIKNLTNNLKKYFSFYVESEEIGWVEQAQSCWGEGRNQICNSWES